MNHEDKSTNRKKNSIMKNTLKYCTYSMLFHGEDRRLNSDYHMVDPVECYVAQLLKRTEP